MLSGELTRYGEGLRNLYLEKFSRDSVSPICASLLFFF
jgi:hypothetical protein